jgi:hypothetical protein
MSTGKSVRLFLADGTPGGLLTAEIMNWTGHIIAAPRSDLSACTAGGPGRHGLLGSCHRHSEQGHQPHQGSRPLPGELLHFPRSAGKPGQANQLHGAGTYRLA